jgi:hypothetical protein
VGFGLKAACSGALLGKILGEKSGPGTTNPELAIVAANSTGTTVDGLHASSALGDAHSSEEPLPTYPWRRKQDPILNSSSSGGSELPILNETTNPKQEFAVDSLQALRLGGGLPKQAPEKANGTLSQPLGRTPMAN